MNHIKTPATQGKNDNETVGQRTGSLCFCGRVINGRLVRLWGVFDDFLWFLDAGVHLNELFIPSGLLRQQVWCYWVPRVAEPWAEGLREGRHQHDSCVSVPSGHRDVQRLQDKVRFATHCMSLRKAVAPGMSLSSVISTVKTCLTNAF